MKVELFTRTKDKQKRGGKEGWSGMGMQYTQYNTMLNITVWKYKFETQKYYMVISETV